MESNLGWKGELEIFMPNPRLIMGSTVQYLSLAERKCAAVTLGSVRE